MDALLALYDAAHAGVAYGGLFATAWYRRYGRWSLLLSWVPVIGDPITVVVRMLRESLAVFLVLVAIAKTGRYLALITGAQWLY